MPGMNILPKSPALSQLLPHQEVILLPLYQNWPELTTQYDHQPRNLHKSFINVFASIQMMNHLVEDGKLGFT